MRDAEAVIREAIDRDRARRWWARCAFCSWGALPYDAIQRDGHDESCPWLTILREASYPAEVDLDGHVDSKGVRYIGKAVRLRGNRYVVLADVGGCLCRVEVALSVEPSR